MSDTAPVTPRYRWGFISPVEGDSEGGGRQSERLLPPDVAILTTGLGLQDYTVDGVEEAMARYWTCVDNLVSRGAQAVSLAGVPISSQLGRPRVLKLLEETKQRSGVEADTANEAIIAAMKHLGVQRIAIASRWAKELNDKLIAYLEAADIQVLTITSEGQWAKEAFGMSIEQGIKLAFLLGREAMRKAPNADALLLPGGTWRSLAAVPILEEDFDRPVFTNTTARAWRLIHQGIAPPVQGWSRLLVNP
jgi:arylmalonate decarboxylase